MSTPRTSTQELNSNKVVNDKLIPIFDTLEKNDEGEIESQSDREDRYMVIKDIENINDPSKWKVHEYFQKVFCQILGILLGLYLELINLV
jgi:hypothetical protein